MKVSIIIPVGNRNEYQRCKTSVERSIASVMACGTVWEIVEVFDDDRYGVAWSRNEGLSRATGDWVAWVDCDDEVTSDWASKIATAIGDSREDEPFDVIVFDAHAEWNDDRDGYDLTYGRDKGWISTEVFASDVIGVGRTGAWLWNKVFRKSLFDGRSFVGGAFEDYRMMCDVLPSARGVKYVPEVLYVYHRSTTGLSQYVNRSASLDGLKGVSDIARKRSDSYRNAMCRGVAIQAADFCRHTGGDVELRSFIRRQIFNVTCARDISFRVKVKCLIEAIKL